MSEIKVNTISERTAANGVAVDGVTIKDSGLTIPSGGTLTVASGGTIDVTSATKTGFPATWAHISTTSNTSNVTQIDFEDVFSATYSVYKLVAVNIHAVDTNGDVDLKLGNPNPSDAVIANIGFSTAGWTNTGTLSSTAGVASDYARIGPDTVPETATVWYAGQNLEITFWNPHGTAQLTKGSFFGYGYNNSQNLQLPVLGGFYDRTNQVGTPVSSTGFRIVGTGGIQGTPTTKFYLYGLEQS